MQIREVISKISLTWHKANNSEEIREIPIVFGKKLPDSYFTFAIWTWKGEGKIQKAYFSFWAPSEIEFLNTEYQIQKYLGMDLIAIGTDGGSIAYLLDFRIASKIRFASVNLGDLDLQEVKVLAESFEEGLSKMVNGQIDGNQL